MSIPTQGVESAAVPEQQPQIASFGRVLQNRNFLLLWMAQLISMTILNAASFGLYVLVSDTTKSVIMTGLVLIAFVLPAVPFSGLAGVVVEKLNKRQILWISNILRMGTMLLMFVLLISNHSDLWPLIGLLFLTSTISLFFTPAENASIPLLVHKDQLMPALALFNITLTVSQALGFLILGRAIAAIFPPFTFQLGTLVWHVQSLDMLFVIVAFLYAVCAILILCIPEKAFEQAHVVRNKRERNEEHLALDKTLAVIWNDMTEGWRIVRSQRLLFFIVIQVSVVGIIMQLISELAGPFVQQVMHRPAEDMTFIMAPAAVGLVGASVLVPRMSARVGKMRLTVIGFVAIAVGFLLLPGLQWVALRIDPLHGGESPFLFLTTVVVVLLLGAAMSIVNIPSVTMMQELSPEEGRARVSALQFMFYSVGTIPVLLFAGVVAQFVGFNYLVALISLSILLFCWWGQQYTRSKKRQWQHDEALDR